MFHYLLSSMINYLDLLNNIKMFRKKLDIHLKSINFQIHGYTVYYNLHYFIPNLYKKKILKKL